MWAVTVRVPRNFEADVVKYRLFKNALLDGEVLQPASGDAQYVYAMADDGTYSLTSVAVDSSGNVSPPSVPLVAVLDKGAPLAPGTLTLTSLTWRLP